FDVDVFDPSIIPATGTPVPGGLGWYMVHDLLDLIMRERTIIGFDVVELAPHQDFEHPSFTAAQLIYNMMGMIERS
ncbi:MAG: agmatinase, partial [Desulfobulbaceae bacterium]|nr:agmatinase [Desulfobulbaceae bacterium]